MNKYSISLLRSLIWELISFKFITEFCKILYSKKKPQLQIERKYRTPLISQTVFVGIHEWGGYRGIRTKKHKNGTEFKCGLVFQLNRFFNYSGKYTIDLSVTLSEKEKCLDLEYIQSKVNKLFFVSNVGYDFSGYSYFYNTIKKNDNSYVILTNTSVNALQTDFLDTYLDYMNQNLDVGMLGVSYCTKCYQSFVRNNFRPHLQSFFILTTIEVLDKMLKYNNGKFPGECINNKYQLIREGEIRLSEIILNLGYSLSTVLEDGCILKFEKMNSWDNSYRYWHHLPKGDMRAYVQNPNSINPIRQELCVH